jgi:hypothetical protein
MTFKQFLFVCIIVVAVFQHFADAQQINSEAGMSSSDIDERLMNDIIIEMMQDQRSRRTFEDEQPDPMEEAQEQQFEQQQQQQQPDDQQVDDTSAIRGEKENAAADVPSVSQQAAPSIPEKKGQNEFVTFVDPVQSARRLDRQTVVKQQVEDKRVPASQHDVITKSSSGPLGSFNDISNMLFLAVVTVCVVAAVIGAAAMGVYWHGLQKERNQAAKEAEYPQYGVIGPSKEKKSRRQNGDEKMAYTAQLHHYQQTKQKIISGEDGSGIQGGGTGAARQQHDESGGESDIDDEANYSVYECPGLAPTGNIEVQNPNFDHGPHNN